MKRLRTTIVFFLLSSLMAFSAAFPVLFSKVYDQRLLGRIHLQKVEAQEVNQSRYSMLDKLRLLYDKRINSKDIVVVKNTQLPDNDLENVKSSCSAELQQLKEKKLFPAIQVDLNSGFDVSSYTCSNTSQPNKVVNFFIIRISSAQYRISLTMDADSNKIYELDMYSASKPLAIDYNNVPLNWQDYIGLSLVKGDNTRASTEGDTGHDNRQLPALNSLANVLEGNIGDAQRPVPAMDQMANAVEDNYSDGTQNVTYFFLIAHDKKSFTISWFFQ